MVIFFRNKLALIFVVNQSFSLNFCIDIAVFFKQ